MMVLVAVCLPLFLIMAAFAVDVAWMQLARTELRTATDSASRAGAKTLSLAQTEAAARAAAKDAARRNRVANTPLVLLDRDIEIGLGRQSTSNDRFTFTSGGTLLNAVRVTGRRTSSSAGGPVALLLGRVMGVTQFQPQHIATSTQLDRDICLVVDRSGSMMESISGGRMPTGACDPPHRTLSRWGAQHRRVWLPRRTRSHGSTRAMCAGELLERRQRLRVQFHHQRHQCPAQLQLHADPQ